MYKRGLDQGVTIAQIPPARRNVVSEVRGPEAALLLSAKEESQNEQGSAK